MYSHVFACICIISYQYVHTHIHVQYIFVSPDLLFPGKSPFLGRALHGGSHGHQDAAVTSSLLSFLTGQILKIGLRWHRVLGNIENYNHQLVVLWYFMIFMEMMVVGKTCRRVFYDVLWASAQVKWVQMSPAQESWGLLKFLLLEMLQALANNGKSRKQHLVF